MPIVQILMRMSRGPVPGDRMIGSKRQTTRSEPIRSESRLKVSMRFSSAGTLGSKPSRS